MNTRYVKLIFVLILLMASINVIAEDINPPNFVSITFENTNVISGSDVKIIGNFTDDDSGVSYADALIFFEGEYLFYVRLWENGSNGLFEGVLSTTGLPSLIYVGDVVVFDLEDNFKTFTNGSSFVAPILTISDPVIDLTPPVLNDIFIEKTNITKFETLTLSLNVTELSGMKDIQANVYAGTNYYSTIANFVYSNGLWNGTLLIDIFTPSSLFIKDIYLVDISYNRILLSNGSDFVSPIIIVQDTTLDLTPPELHSIRFARLNGSNEYNIIDIYGNFSDAGSGVNYAIATLSSKLKKDSMTVTLFWDPDLNYFYGQVSVTNKVAEYLWISEVEIFDNAHNHAIFRNSTDFATPELIIDFTDPFSDLNIVNYAIYTGTVTFNITTSEPGRFKLWINTTGTDYIVDGTFDANQNFVFTFDSTQVPDALYNVTLHVWDIYDNKIVSAFYFYINNDGTFDGLWLDNNLQFTLKIPEDEQINLNENIRLGEKLKIILVNSEQSSRNWNFNPVQILILLSIIMIFRRKR